MDDMKLTDYHRDILLAVQRGDVHEVDLLLDDHSVDLESDTYIDYYLVREALICKNVEVAKFLIAKGFRVFKKPSMKLENTILYLTAEFGDEDLIKILLDKGALRDVNKTIWNAKLKIRQEHIEFINMLLSNYNVTRINSSSFNDVAPFFIASICGNLDFIKKVLRSSLLSIDTQVKELFINDMSSGRTGWTALHFAVFNDKVDVVEFLLNEGASVIIQEQLARTPVHIAFQKKNYKVVDLILSYHTDFHLNPVSWLGISHFHIACTRNNLIIVENFIKNTDSVDISYLSDTHSIWNGCTPLHFAIMYNKVNVVKLLLQNNASVHVKDGNGSTPLHLACRNTKEKFEQFCVETTFIKNNFDWSPNRKDHLKIVELLLQNKSDVNAVDNLDKGALYYAFNYGFDEQQWNFEWHRQSFSLEIELSTRYSIIVDMLLKHNIDWNKHNRSILNYILKTNQTDASKVFKLLSVNGAVFDPTTMSALLHSEFSNENYKAVITLLKFGADINSEDSACKTITCFVEEFSEMDEYYYFLFEDNFDHDFIFAVRFIHWHVSRLIAIGKFISEKVANNMKILKKLVNRSDNEIIEKCNEEISILKRTKIDDDNSLYDVLFKNENAMAKLVKNTKFKNIIVTGTRKIQKLRQFFIRKI